MIYGLWSSLNGNSPAPYTSTPPSAARHPPPRRSIDVADISGPTTSSNLLMPGSPLAQRRQQYNNVPMQRAGSNQSSTSTASTNSTSPAGSPSTSNALPNPFGFLKRSTSQYSNQANKENAGPLSPKDAQSSGGWIGRVIGHNNAQHGTNQQQQQHQVPQYAHHQQGQSPQSNNQKRTSYQQQPSAALPSGGPRGPSPLGATTAGKSSDSNSGGRSSIFSGIGSTKSSAPTTHSQVTSQAMSTNGSSGSGSGGKRASVHAAAIAHAKAVRQDWDAVFTSPRPEDAFKLVEVIGKGSFGIVHKA